MKTQLIIAAAAVLSSSVTAPAAFVIKAVSDYGAVGNGSTDDTAAFNNCLAANTVCWVDSGKKYVVGNVIMNDGNRLQGFGSVQYGTATAATSPVLPTLIGKTGSVRMIDVSRVRTGGAIVGLMLDCRSSSMDGISSGSFQLTLDQITVVGCNDGFGGGNTYTGEAHISNSTFGNNARGVVNLIDSFVSNTDFAGNTNNGMYLGTGANANTITNSRFEWNQGYGFLTYGGTEANNISNCIFDRNYKAGVALDGATGINVSGSTFSRNGRNGAGPDQNAQVYITRSRAVNLTGNISKIGMDDGGTGPVTPAYVISYGATSTYVTVNGLNTGGRYSATNTSGGYVTGVVVGTAPTTGYIFANVSQ
jgi:hypothetical protein